MTRQLCYRGTVNTWECDEMGHMNVRFYLGKAHQGLQQFGAFIGLGPKVLEEMRAELVIEEQHIRYIRELHAGADLSIEAGIAEAHASGFLAYQEVLPLAASHVSASMISRVTLRDVASGNLVDLPGPIQKAVANFQTEIPDYAQPRSLKLGGVIPGKSAEEALANNHLEVSAGAVRSSQVDRNGYLYTDEFMGFISDGIGNLFGLLTRDLDTAMYERSEDVGGAALEYRFEFLRRPRTGDLVRILSAPVKVEEKIYMLRHIMVDGETGEPLARANSVHCAFNLKTRRSIPVPDLLRRGLETHLASK